MNERKFTVLLTNDDGIHSSGLQVLKKRLEEYYQVFIVAPDREMSASSMSLTLNHPLRVSEVAENCWVINGTTSDCINIALQKLLNQKPDFVISGMNLGENLGEDIFFSGTVAGAFSAQLYGLKAMAVSLTGELGNYQKHDFDFDSAARITLKIVEKLIVTDFNGLVYNLNIPLPNNGQLMITHPGSKRYLPDIIERRDPRGRKYFWIGVGKPQYFLKEQSDVWAIANRYISLSLIQYSLSCNSDLQTKVQQHFASFEL